MNAQSPAAAAAGRTSAVGIFAVFLKLGCTSFGGPVAHVGYFRTEFVARRRWLTDAAYADLVALCQFLPGPASSQVGIALGLARGGLAGALAAWLGFTLPSALALVAFGLLLAHWGTFTGAWLHGLKVVAVAVVAQALWGMGRSLCPDRARASMAIAAAVIAAAAPGVMGQVGVIVGGGLIGLLALRTTADFPHSPLPVPVNKRAGMIVLALFLGLLVALPLAASYSGAYALHLADSFYRAGSLVFGGGHVVLPVLRAEVVPPGWVGEQAFLAGYGAAQAVPGPLFTFAAYLGAVSSQSPNGWLGASIALISIFLPAFLLVIGALPLWESARRHPAMQRAMLGVNAAVVGLLLAAFYQPVWTGAINSPQDFGLAALALLLLMFWKVPSWAVVIFCAAAAGFGWH